MSDAANATIFSQTYQFGFNRPLTKASLENVLKSFLMAVAEPLAFNGVILGHIKMLAKLPEGDDYLFFSITRLDAVDVKTSSVPVHEAATFCKAQVDLNVLIFGPDTDTVTLFVSQALDQLRGQGVSIA